MKHIEITHQIVSRETFAAADELRSKYREELEYYLEQLLWWNKRLNLVSRNVSRETIWEHIRHSLLIAQLSPFKRTAVVVDAGTGGGLPALPLAITYPKKKFILNDIVSKKCMALKQMVRKIGLKNSTIFAGSIEKLSYNKPFLLISKHAFKINEIYSLTSSLPWQEMILYKGIDFEEELTGIDDSLKIEAYDLSNGSDFYKDKAFLMIKRD